MRDPRRDLFGELDAMQQEMERFLDYVARSKRPPMVFYPPAWQPPIDVLETETDVIVLMEIAGVKIDDLDAQLDGSTLILRGRRAGPTCDRSADPDCARKEVYHVMEIKSGEFERSVKLPASVDPDKTTALYHDGILQLTLPKVREPRSAHVKIKTT